ncbi:MAG: Methionine adenosyltransferase [Candidatus Parvarchaeum acidiphilum ARMAN-4]|uniref:Methionine adenosyltransferase n=1 Tax=Candidatus Parvarchaeum acidiphilum ARMAN-4 TaxID=662760 RepID=D2EE69_PARA4|nr:MAG: Methionine adenosyltransferase [Candidatus Parvarchaeum acidiphilum ARMAN-4]
MNFIAIDKDNAKYIEKQRIEIVERKGLGHPDYLADSIAENFSINLSKYYIEHFGRILHHNVDKLEVIGGETKPAFNGGKITKPITILFSGRATGSVDNDTIPLKEIAENSAKTWIKHNIRFLDADKLRYLFETNNGSVNLADAFQRNGKPGSNDTSFAVGYYPYSVLENLVLKTENYLNSKEFKSKFQFSGEDIKIMGVRIKNKIKITIAMAMVDKFISSEDDYFKKKKEVAEDALEYIKNLNEKLENESMINQKRKIELAINGMDKKNRGIKGCYLTVTGLSAESGDDGAVGRGNRVNGLITPNRVMTLEAAAGKNPVNHIGKIYSLFSFDLSKKIYDKFGIKNQIKMVGRIGNDLSKPLAFSLVLERNADKTQKKDIMAFINEELLSINEITNKIIEGQFKVC